MSRERFIEIVAELHAIDEQLRPLLDRKAALEAERDALWPETLPAPSQLSQHFDATPIRRRGAIRIDGPTAGPRVLAYMEANPGAWLKARQVCEGMGLGAEMIQAIRASLDRLVPTGAIQKNEHGEFRLASGHASRREANP